jgi:uroporphyrinogen decarboxylase
LKVRHPGLKVIAFPRGAGVRYQGFAEAAGVDCVALDQSVDPDWAATHVQNGGCVQGNLDPALLVTGGQPLIDAARHIVEAFSQGPHVFNLGHGITPDADPANVALLVDTIRG